jgi:hypothetical protein
LGPALGGHKHFGKLQSSLNVILIFSSVASLSAQPLESRKSECDRIANTYWIQTVLIFVNSRIP